MKRPLSATEPAELGAAVLAVITLGIAGCTHNIKVEPIYMTLEIRIKVERELEEFFEFEDRLEPERTPAARDRTHQLPARHASHHRYPGDRLAMNAAAEWCRRIWYLLTRHRRDAELRADIEAHRAMMDNPGRFGSPLHWREASRDVWGWRWLDDLQQDIRYALRSLAAHRASGQSPPTG